jgi:hypothetical protein
MVAVLVRNGPGDGGLRYVCFVQDLVYVAALRHRDILEVWWSLGKGTACLELPLAYGVRYSLSVLLRAKGLID